MDPGFSYYKDRSPDSIADEISAHGFDVVEYIVTADSDINPALIAALQNKGMGVWYLTFGNGTYSTKDLPTGWQAWKLSTPAAGFNAFSLNDPNYRAWKKSEIVQSLKRYPFDGVDITEPYWTDQTNYGPFDRAAFLKMYPEEKSPPNMTQTDSPDSKQNNPTLWQKWLSFRQASVTNFLDDLVNGPGGIRKSCPHTKIRLWTLGQTGPDPVQTLRDANGENAAEIVRTVHPDMFAIETNWPDWTQADLKPDYILDYKPVVQSILSVAPHMPLLLQTDVGSQHQNLRDWNWIHAYEYACKQLGVGSRTFYEYSIGNYMYTDPPHIEKARRSGNTVYLVFSDRIDSAIASDTSHYSLQPGRIQSILVDGNIVRLRLSGGAAGVNYTLTVKGIANDQARLLYKDLPPVVMSKEAVTF